MERSAIKGMSQLTLNESETKKTRPRKRDIGRIRVRGYNTDLPHDDVVSALRKHFSSCGEITDVYIFEKTDGLHSFGFIYFLGEGAVDKALQLSGIDVGGWTVIAEPYPFTEHAGCYPAVVVQGYDTLLDNADIEKMLFEHFSSCAEVTEIRVHKRSIGAAVVELYGEDAEQKVMDLDGSIMVGCKISVTLYTAPTVYSVHPRRRRNRNYYPVALCFDS
ncbi:nucleolin 2-like [Brassica napus]|uniref:nucleolin 2-like n=1 Tax=Brassica napus TaxID=3708 RepID=UPI0006AB6CE6|nr:nucleolin 2-like [Brassica napus]